MPAVIHETAQENLDNLGADFRPGQGIVVGPNTLGDMALQVFWLTGRNEEISDHGIPMDGARGYHIAANGDHINGLIAGIRAGRLFPNAFKDSVEELEGSSSVPTRIAAALSIGDRLEGRDIGYQFSISRDGSPGRMYLAGKFADTDNGLGRCVSTYLDDGSLPSFGSRDYDVMPLGERAQDTAELYWENLDEPLRRVVMVKGWDLATGTRSEGFVANEEWYERHSVYGMDQAPAE